MGHRDEIPGEIQERMRLADLSIEPDLSEVEEWIVWQGGQQVRSGLWEDCMRYISWVVRDEQ
jgi:hypothetical protein